MIIEVITWFEEVKQTPESLGCQVAFTVIDRPVLNNPPFIYVTTNYEEVDKEGVIYAENEHVFEKLDRGYIYSFPDNYRPFGFWKIKYKE